MIYPAASITATLRIRTKATGALVTPSTLVVSVWRPGGTLFVTYTSPGDEEVVVESVGVMSVAMTVPNSNASDTVGEWIVRGVGTGSNAGSGETVFTVHRSKAATP